MRNIVTSQIIRHWNDQPDNTYYWKPRKVSIIMTTPDPNGDRVMVIGPFACLGDALNYSLDNLHPEANKISYADHKEP